MELYNNPDIFQNQMNKLFNGLEYFRAYIDDFLSLVMKTLKTTKIK